MRDKESKLARRIKNHLTNEKLGGSFSHVVLSPKGVEYAVWGYIFEMDFVSGKKKYVLKISGDGGELISEEIIYEDADHEAAILERNYRVLRKYLNGRPNKQ